MKAAALYADFYHRSKIAEAREEGDRLRTKLRQLGVDPGAVLVEADVERALLRPEPDVEHHVNEHAGDRDVHPQRPRPA